MKQKIQLSVLAFFCFSLTSLWSQCPNCGNGLIDPGETYLNCPADVLGTNIPASCVANCDQPAGKDPATGLRVTGIDFSTTTTNYYSPASATAATLPQTLPTGWAFGGANAATTATAVPAADVFGSQTGVVQPTGCCSNGQNGFVTASFTSSSAVGSGGCGGLLGANFDGQNNVSSNPSFVVLRGGTGTTKPTLVFSSYNNSAVEVFKIQFFIGAGGSWSCVTLPQVFLDFSADGGSSWVQIMQMGTGTSTDMCSGLTSNTAWFSEGGWSRVCLTVFKSAASGNHPAGNYYAHAAGNTAPSGMMVDNRWFTANFRYRLRFNGGCGGITAATNFNGTKPPGNPGLYVYVDYPVFTSGNQCIPCGLSFVNMCGFGDDTNDDGVGSDLFTTSTTPVGTVRKGVNMAEKGAEIFTLNGTSLSGSLFSTNDILCDAEGRDKQCMTANGLAVQFLVTQDYQPSGSCGSASIPTLNYYRLSSHGASTATTQSITMSPVTMSGRTNLIGWRSRATIFLQCNGGVGDTHGACLGYLFSVPTSTKQPRGFYNLFINNTTGRASSVYGAASTCRGYFAGPVVGPLSDVDLSQPDTDQGTGCDGANLVFTADARLCNGSPAQAMRVTVQGPLPSLATHSSYLSGADGTVAISQPGEYLISTEPANTDSRTWGCIDCKRTQCVQVTQAMIEDCVVLSLESLGLEATWLEGNKALLVWPSDLSKNRASTLRIERSANGRDFETLAELPATLAEFIDVQPLPGDNYYRLQDQDTQGLRRYSPIRQLFFAQTQAELLGLVQEGQRLSARFYLPEAQLVDCRILDAWGRPLSQNRFQGQAGSQSLDLDLGQAPAGFYILQIQGRASTRLSRQFIWKN